VHPLPLIHLYKGMCILCHSYICTRACASSATHTFVQGHVHPLPLTHLYKGMCILCHLYMCARACASSAQVDLILYIWTRACANSNSHKSAQGHVHHPTTYTFVQGHGQVLSVLHLTKVIWVSLSRKADHGVFGLPGIVIHRLTLLHRRKGLSVSELEISKQSDHCFTEKSLSLLTTIKYPKSI
jgi:hypothetical protein